MHIGIPQETRADETRVAATPETIKKYVAQGHQVTVQSGAGVAAAQPDEAYVAVGAKIGTAAEALGAQIVLKVLTGTCGACADASRRRAGRHAQPV